MGNSAATDETPVERAVKFVGKNTIEGLAIPYGGTFAGKDIAGESFDANTDFCLEWFGESGRPVLYDHGLDQSMKTGVIGRQTEYEKRAEGIWAQSQLDDNAKYRKAVDSLIERGALGYSSGSMPHLAMKNARTGIITRWPWVELSLTPMPAEPSTLGVYYVKSASAIAHLEAVDVAIPDPLKAALAALDDWADSRDDLPAGLSYADEGDRVLVAAKAFADRTVDLSLVRAKSGRVLSAANRARIAELRARIAESTEHAAGVLQDLDDLLTATDPEQVTKSLFDLSLDYERTLARLSGVDFPQGAPS